MKNFMRRLVLTTCLSVTGPLAANPPAAGDGAAEASADEAGFAQLLRISPPPALSERERGL